MKCLTRVVVVSLLTIAASPAIPQETSPPSVPKDSLSQAIAYYLGTGGQVNLIKAKSLFLEAAKTGDPLATVWLARCYHRGRCGFPKDPSQAEELARGAIGHVEKLGREGNPAAMALWACILDEGLGVAPCPEEAARWYLKAAEAGDVLAMGNLACKLYEKGDRREAVNWYRKAADAGLASAMCTLGRIYMYQKKEGTGITRDPRQGFRWFLKASQAGNAPAMSCLGEAYLDGLGVERNPQKAADWWRKGAELGDAGCMCNLGYCYGHGVGLAEDHTKARLWYRRGAECGNALAMLSLAHLLVHGKGGPQNVTQAFHWLGRSVDAGCPEAKAALAQYQKEMVELERERAELDRQAESARRQRVSRGGTPAAAVEGLHAAGGTLGRRK